VTYPGFAAVDNAGVYGVVSKSQILCDTYDPNETYQTCKVMEGFLFDREKLTPRKALVERKNLVFAGRGFGSTEGEAWTWSSSPNLSGSNLSVQGLGWKMTRPDPLLRVQLPPGV